MSIDKIWRSFLWANMYHKGKRHARRKKHLSAFILMGDPELANAYRQGHQEAAQQ